MYDFGVTPRECQYDCENVDEKGTAGAEKCFHIRSSCWLMLKGLKWTSQYKPSAA